MDSLSNSCPWSWVHPEGDALAYRKGEAAYLFSCNDERDFPGHWDELFLVYSSRIPEEHFLQKGEELLDSPASIQRLLSYTEEEDGKQLLEVALHLGAMPKSAVGFWHTRLIKIK